MVERAADAGDGELPDAAWRSVAVRIGRAPRRRGERPPGPQRRARDIAEAVGLCVPAEAGTQGTYETRETLGSCFRRSTSSPPAHLPPRFGDFLDIVGDLDERRGIVAEAGVDHRLVRALIEPGERFRDLAAALEIQIGIAPCWDRVSQ